MMSDEVTRSSHRLASRAAAMLLSAAGVCLAAHAANTATDVLPEPGPERKVSIPAVHDATLPNGLRVVVVNRAVTPLVSVALYLRSGAEVDPPQLAGLTDLTAGLLDKGTTTRTAPQIAEAADALGGSLGTGAGFDVSQASISVTTPKLGAALDLLADVVRHPTFAQEEIDRERKQMLDDLRLALSQPGSVARLVAARAIYGDGAYGHSAGGTRKSLPRIQRADIVRLHDTYYRPDNAVLVFAGDVDLEHAVQTATSAFGDWKAPATPLPQAPAGLGKSALAADVIVDIPGTGQAAVSAVHRGIARADKDYYAGIVTNAVLGGSYSARLNEEIRIKRGLSYGAGSALDARRQAGSFGGSAQTKNPSAVEVVGLLLGEFERLAMTPPDADELAARKATLSGNFGFSLETTRGLLGEVAGLALYGLPLDELAHYLDRIQAISAEQVRDFAKAHLGKDGTRVIVAGDAKQFADALAKAYPKVERLDAATLDLDSPTLRPASTKK
ncbi:MAG TPA: pitrilysin family protein [Rudaea sp.]|nr:pitrilysin family protein [Rudaea sp.]